MFRTWIGKVQRYLFKPIIPLIKLEGVIDQKMHRQVEYCLQKINVERCNALALVINSPGKINDV